MAPRRSRSPRRDLNTKLTAVLGPTNTGKTHYAIERMLGHESGMIGLPLRLLAREVYDRIKTEKGANAVALITGEEKISPPHARYFVCTVEAMPQDRPVSFLAIDEVQLCADPERGHVFTDRLLHARGEHETMFLGADTMRNLLRELLPDIEFVTRSRFSHLSFAGSKKISRLPRRSAVVAFSADNVYSIAELIRRHCGGAAVVLGALSPRTRNAQVELYQSGEVDFMVATDAIGMGLNMDVDHVAFASLQKFDGRRIRSLDASELAQVAGRAGRYMNDGTFGTTADAGTFDEMMVERIENHRFDPIRVLQWRNNGLAFSTIDALIGSLEVASDRQGLVRTRDSDDFLALRSLSQDSEIRQFAAGPAAVKTLWQVCQVPDFRKTMHDEHVRLLSNIYQHLMGHDGAIDEDWLAAHVNRLDRTEGDLDTLSNRIAFVRTWTFVSNRSGWLRDPIYWQERTRAIEDKLSDALHERLTQRFIDRRTSLLVKRLKDNVALMAGINSEGEVTVEGEFVGRLNGFRFLPDPRVTSGNALEGKALRAAATKALEPEIAARATRLIESQQNAIELRSDATLWWEDGQIARLKDTENALAPEMELIADSLMTAAMREQALDRLKNWRDKYFENRLEPLLTLERAVNAPVKADDKNALTGLARGIGYQLVEALGFLDRPSVQDDVKSLDQSSRAQLRKLGVRFGEFSIFMPALLKPKPASLLVVLKAVVQGKQNDGSPFDPMTAGLTSLPTEKNISNDHYFAAGFRRCGERAIRIDMLERLADIVRSEKSAQEKQWKTRNKSNRPFSTFPAFKDRPKVTLPRGAFASTPEMMSLVGCGGEDFDNILGALGYRKLTLRDDDKVEHVLWRYHLPASSRPTRQPSRAKGGKPKGDTGRKVGNNGHAHNKAAGQSKTAAKGKGSKRPAASKPKPKPIDPDSPFAILKNLKN